ncbi:MAG: non-ribosomal peptide synthetase, partial [Pseudomonadota bacterium]
AEDDFSLAAQLRRHRVTHLQCTPSMARMLVLNDESRAALRGLKEVMIGGEALPGALVSDIEAATGARIQNMYGPTETTIWSTTAAATADRAVVDLGTPIANTTLYVLDDAHRPVPIGAAGELWIGGEGVARGYWQREELTAERFRPNPFGPGRIYGTGDLVRRRADGGFEFLGRVDYQVKIRGYRIELGEIEAAAEAEPGVTQAVVIAREEVAGDPRLIAYVTATPAFSAEGLKTALAAQLPPHMVPSVIVALDAMPLTPNGKVDRKALPAPAEIAKAAPAAYEAPETGVAATIAGIWSKILGVPQVGARDNFFELGGHSLLAVQAHREIKAALSGAKLSITDIFRFPTLEGLSAHLDTDPKSPEPAEAGPAASDRAAARAEAMAKRRALRAGRRG